MRTTSQEDLLLYYQRELTYLRKMGAASAARHPQGGESAEPGADECAGPL